MDAYDEIRDALVENGKMSAETRSRLTLAALAVVIEEQREVKESVEKVGAQTGKALSEIANVSKRVEELERIVFWPTRHPKLTMTIAGLAILLLTSGVFHNVIRPVLLVLGIPSEAIPP